MSVTEATAVGPKAHKKAGSSLYRFKLTPGVAYLIDDVDRSVDTIVLTREAARRAKPSWMLRFINGRTVAEFQLDGKTLAQPIPVDQEKARARPKVTPKAGPPDLL